MLQLIRHDLRGLLLHLLGWGGLAGPDFFGAAVNQRQEAAEVVGFPTRLHALLEERLELGNILGHARADGAEVVHEAADLDEVHGAEHLLLAGQIEADYAVLRDFFNRLGNGQGKLALKLLLLLLLH